MIPNKTLLPGLIFLFSFSIIAACEENVGVDPVINDGDLVLESVESNEETFNVVRVVDDLSHPWAVAWLPGGEMLITERAGRLNLVDNETVTELDGLPEIQASGQGGLLDVALHPDYEENGWIYFTYSYVGDGGSNTALARAQLSDGELTDVEELYQPEITYTETQHFGSRIVIPGDGTVVFTIGDRGNRDQAQDRSDPTGSTIRLNEDGSIPDDNPFVNEEDVTPEIYTYGHRNAQGMDIHPETGVIWQHEHGPRGGDEINIIESGQNYGWPIATYGTEYGDDSEIGINPDEDPDIVDPVLHWSPTSIAPSGMTFYSGEHFPGWDGDIFAGALANQHIRRVVLDGDEAVEEEELIRDEIGRIRDVREGPDGLIYFLTDETDGGLYRIEPVDM